MIIIILTLSLVMLGFAFGITEYYYSGIANTFETHAQGVSPVWQGEFDFTKSKVIAYSDKIIENYKYKDAQLDLLDRNGKLIQSSSGFYEDISYSIDSTIMDFKNIHRVETIENTEENIMAVYSPLLYKGQVVGVLRYSSSLTKVNQIIRSFIGYGLALCFVASVIAFMVSYHLGNSFVRPVKDIIRFTQNMAEGQFKIRIEEEYPYELGELAKHLNYMGDEIVKTDQLKNDFISSISHELRTPLTGIKGWVETMKEPGSLTEEELQFGMTMIDHETERFIRLVENLLDFSRYQSDRMNLYVTSVSLEELINEVTFQLQKKAEEKELRIITETSPATIKADEYKIKQVILNVLDNAIKFSHTGEDIYINLITQKESVEIHIQDQGIGIENEYLIHTMETFYKIDPKSVGAGLGLAISKKIVDMHKGTLRIVSKYGEGTTVIITLPYDIN